MKKITLLGTLLFTLVLTGCSSKPDAQNVSTKAISASKSIKSGSANIISSSDNDGQKVSSTLNGKFNSSPEIYHISQKSNDKYLGQYYLTGKTIYISSSKKWYKRSSSAALANVATLKNQLTAAQSITILKHIKKNVKVESHKNNYVLSYSGKGKVASKGVKSALRTSFDSSVPSSAIDQLLKTVNVKHLTFKYTVNKKTYLPTQSLVEMKYKDSKSGQSVTQKVTGKYSKVNKTKSFQVPDSIKSTAKLAKTK